MHINDIMGSAVHALFLRMPPAVPLTRCPLYSSATFALSRRLRCVSLRLFNKNTAANERAWKSMVSEEHLLFVCDRDRFFRLSSAMAVSQTVFWLFVGAILSFPREGKEEEGGGPILGTGKRPPVCVFACLCMYVYMYVCMYVCVCVCVHLYTSAVCVCVYVHIYI